MGEVAVVGGGAAGMFAAVTAAANGQKVTLLEKNEKLGKKLFLTGKGRCNLTNNCDQAALLESVCSNRKFLYSAFRGFDSQDTIRYFECCGVKTKTERGNRVFPVSDHSFDVIAALSRELKRLQVCVCLRTTVQEILTEPLPDCQMQNPEEENREISLADANASSSAAYCDTESRKGKRTAGKKKGGKVSPKYKVTGVKLQNGQCLFADAVIIATGGLSYPSTGSTGDGYRFAKALGHTVTELSPSLVPLTVAEEDAARMQGLSLKNVRISVRDNDKLLYEGFGEMLFTHFGVSGPLILSASSQIAEALKKHPLRLSIDLKPALSLQQLEARILREFDQNPNKQVKNILGALYPAKLIPVMLQRSGISPEKQVHDITREERRSLAELTKEFPLTVTGLRDYNEAVITRGGVCVQEINPQTMESKRVLGLYFAGEVLDVDAVTGGFNLQIAWSTAYAAGKSVCGG